jgi:hypothetical protein
MVAHLPSAHLPTLERPWLLCPRGWGRSLFPPRYPSRASRKVRGALKLARGCVTHKRLTMQMFFS